MTSTLASLLPQIPSFFVQIFLFGVCVFAMFKIRSSGTIVMTMGQGLRLITYLIHVVAIAYFNFGSGGFNNLSTILMIVNVLSFIGMFIFAIGLLMVIFEYINFQKWSKRAGG